MNHPAYEECVSKGERLSTKKDQSRVGRRLTAIVAALEEIPSVILADNPPPCLLEVAEKRRRTASSRQTPFKPRADWR